ncbi:putative toxin biosynthesis cytochrome p450 protein [Botrytis fragariae]|uniref:Putative toxin biosynthesis cytochrome p450 protein n=1 Tax=Botrytis fragariae TaxID=1964551 RepID=A0A8H6AK22_9HELO|nr:putative toxin biosynthesis cytochrome p450 protein [Botrytis fragariae]KAF5868705.1 putative toxin biosynthesis cytochrome p450 protein [Botrytis fragariae]
MYFIIIVAAVAIGSLFYFLGCCIYNLFFHPLKSYPGPKLWAACRIPMTYWKLKGVLPYKIKELHDQYGDAVRVAPNFLDYNSSVAWEDIYGFVKDHHRKNFPKDLKERGVQKNQGSNIIIANEEDHRRFRRLQSHVFSDKALTSQEPLIQDYARQFISGLIKFSSLTSDNDINIGQWYNYTTFDLIGDLAFGEPFGCVKTGETHHWIDLIFKILEIGTVINEARKYPILGAIAFFFIPRGMKGRFERHRQLGREKANRRLDTPRDKPDFTSYILKHNDTEKGMTREEIGENASILIIAGSETTASLLNGVTYYLLRTPTVLQNLTLELRSTFQTQEDLSLHALASCKYLNAVLEEGLRMYPPVPSTLGRVVPEGGSIVAGQYVPAGVSVGVNFISSQLSAENFHLPYEFHPERWLGTADVEELKSAFPDMKLTDPKIFEGDDRKARQPFSVGPANCIGKNLAYAEMRVLLGNVVWGFDLEGARDSESWLERNRIYALWKKPELWVKLKRVNV